MFRAQSRRTDRCTPRPPCEDARGRFHGHPDLLPDLPVDGAERADRSREPLKRVDPAVRSGSSSRHRLVWIVLAALALAAIVVAQVWIGRHLETRFRAALVEQERPGSLERVSVCLPCLSYTIHGVEVENARKSEAPVESRLSAERIVVALHRTRLLRGALRGRITIPGAELYVAVDEREDDRAGFAVEWQNLGRGLFPFPFDRIEAPGSALIVHDRRSPEPIQWRFDIESGYAENLALADGDPRVFVSGATPGGGTFEFVLDVERRDPPSSTFRGALRAVRLEEIRGYLRQRLGLDVEGGRMSADIDLAVTNAGWTGHIDCELSEVELFEIRDLVEGGPIQAAADGLAAVMAELRKDDDRVLRVRFEVDERVTPDESQDWPLTISARLLRWVFLAPFELPLRLVGIDTFADR